MEDKTQGEEQTMLGKALDLLNKAVKADPDAMHQLVNYRVECLDSVAQDTPIVTRKGSDDRRRFGVVGLINALVQEKDEDGSARRVGARWDPHYGTLIGFEIVDEKEEKAQKQAIAEQLGVTRMKNTLELAEERKRHEEERRRHEAAKRSEGKE